MRLRRSDYSACLLARRALLGVLLRLVPALLAAACGCSVKSPAPVGSVVAEGTGEVSQSVESIEPQHPRNGSSAAPASPTPLGGFVTDLCLRLGERYDVSTRDISAGVLDLGPSGYAMVNGDVVRYGASLPKLLILVAAFEEEARDSLALDDETRSELVRMIRASSNEDAAALVSKLSLDAVIKVADSPRYGLHDPERGGLWTGKRYMVDEAPEVDPASGLTHTATVRQLLRFYSMLDHGLLVSGKASEEMRRIFVDPTVPLTPNMFAGALADRDVTMLRKWGQWEDFYGDSALIEGPNRRYVMTALLQSPQGEAFLRDFAVAVDDYFAEAVGDPTPWAADAQSS